MLEKSLSHVCVFVLFGLIFYVPVNNLSVMSGRFPRLKLYQAVLIKCLAQGQSIAPMVGFESTSSLSCTLQTEEWCPSIKTACVFRISSDGMEVALIV